MKAVVLSAAVLAWLYVCVESCPSVHSRSDWGAGPSPARNISPVKYMFIHHTDTPACKNVAECKRRVQSIYNYHKNERKWADIGYNFLIGGDGSIFEGRGWGKEGAHTRGFNSVGHAISFIGDFTNTSPSEAALQSAKSLIKCGLKLGKIRSDYKLMGHRDVGQTTCPGNKLYQIIQKWDKYSNKK